MQIGPLLAGTAAALLLGAAPASAAFPGANGRIAFQGANRIDTINASGGDRRTLVGPAMAPTFFSTPAWSPDGTKVAYASDVAGGDSDIYVISAASGAITPLTNNAFDDGNPAWSPDGTKIAFQSDRDSVGRNQLFVMNADGSGAFSLSPNPGFDDSQPAWSPDGTKIAFARGPDIWVTAATGGQGTALTNDPADEGEPDWSPDGSKIVFQRGASPATAIVVMGANGSNQTPLPLPSGSSSPVWSPDGTKIAYEFNLEIVAANADGTGPTPLTTNGGQAFIGTNPDWQPIPAPPPPPPPGADQDHDGVSAPLDCNDSNPAIRPGARDKPGDKIDQDCNGRDAPFPLPRRSIEAFSATYPLGRYTTFTSMTVKPVRRGDRLRLTCKGPGCPFKKKTIKIRKNAKKLSLLRHLKRAKLRKGAVVQLRITRPETIGRVSTWKIRAPKTPKTSRSCLQPGAKKTSRCPRS